LRGHALFIPFLKKGTAKNFCFFERIAFKMNKVKERQFLVGVWGAKPLQQKSRKIPKIQQKNRHHVHRG